MVSGSTDSGSKDTAQGNAAYRNAAKWNEIRCHGVERERDVGIGEARQRHKKNGKVMRDRLNAWSRVGR